MPSPCAPLTSAPCLSSARSASRSPFIAASATGELEAAANNADNDNATNDEHANRRFISFSGHFNVAQPFRAARRPLAGLKACATRGRRYLLVSAGSKSQSPLVP